MLSKKVAIVTGAGSGIGEAIALLFAKNGARVVVADVDKKGGKRVVKKITKSGGTALFVECDVSDPRANAALVKTTLKEFKRLDIAVNNAGVGGAQAPVGDYGVEDWQRVIDINLSGVFYGMHHQIPAMKKGGAVVNMASILGQVGTPQSPAYVAAKHGVIGLSRSAALAYAQQKIRVNAVGPGYVETPLLTDNLPQEQLAEIKKLHPVGRLGKPGEVAELVLWLCSDKASFVTGAYYNVDGGYLAQ